MATVLSDEIDILAKAKRAIGDDYVPSDAEAYMSEPQLDYFRRLLLTWKKSILDAVRRARCSSSRTARSASPTSTTAHRARPTGASNCAPATASAS